MATEIIKGTSVVRDYPVAQGNVILRITIGEGQFGASLIALGDQVLRAGTIRNQTIGRGPALAGKTLTVRTLVSDTNTQTNRMSVTYALEGGPQSQTFILESEVERAGDATTFEATFTLKS